MKTQWPDRQSNPATSLDSLALSLPNLATPNLTKPFLAVTFENPIARFEVYQRRQLADA